MRFLRTIRLDASDVQVFPVAAEPGEWAVPGSFAFANCRPEALTGKSRQAFANGFLGTGSFGWSSLVAVADITAVELTAITVTLTHALLERYGAPDFAAAAAAAHAEAEFASGLCEHKINTLIALDRSLGSDGVVERFRVIEPPRQALHAKIWEIVETQYDC